MNSTVNVHRGAAFAALGLSSCFVRAVADEGYETPTPIQTQAIPVALAGRDVLACAQTGTGKTAAFLLPLLQALAARPRTGRIRALVLAPTRELAAQIGECAKAYGRLCNVRHAVIYGGVGAVIYGGVGQRGQELALQARPDLLVATTGRLLDLVGQGLVSLDAIEIFVLDEADRMLDMGFIHDVRRIVRQLPTQRQTLLFSATMPPDIADLARQALTDPVRIAVAPQATTAERIAQVVHFVPKTEKRAALERVLRDEGAVRTLVFTRTKHGANRLAEQLERAGIDAAAIHGNKSQGARERALEGFRSGSISVLVATDIAARGIDVDDVTHVVNFDLPNVPEQYVHRIGRTGRAGAHGKAISLVAEDERGLLADVERLIRTRLPISPIVGAVRELSAREPVADRAAAPSGEEASAVRHAVWSARPRQGYRGRRGAKIR
jgi:ATP-dependent RNA helicase RhlE